MAKNKEAITTNGKAAFYASIWPDIKQAALDCGWALGLHGSLNSDMDIMAMPWTEEATSKEELINSILKCFEGNIFNDISKIPYYNKPNNRIVYTIHIFKDYYLDINIIKGLK